MPWFRPYSETHGFKATRRSLAALPLKAESSDDFRANVSLLESWYPPEQHSHSHTVTLIRCGVDRGERTELSQVIANSMTVLSNGVWALPFWREQPHKSAKGADSLCHVEDPREEAALTSAGVLLSSDFGRSWTPHGTLTHPHTVSAHTHTHRREPKSGCG